MDHPIAGHLGYIKTSTLRLRLAGHAHGQQEVRLTMRPVRSPATNPLAIVLTACCKLYRARSAHGTINMDFIEQLPALNGSTAILEVIDRLRKVFSFQLWTILLPRTLQMHSFPYVLKA